MHFIDELGCNDSWVPLSNIYKINPQTKRIFEKVKAGVKKPDNLHENSCGKPPKVSTVTNTGLDMEGVASGIEFEHGGALFVDWKNVLYRAKMLKKKKRGKVTKYFVHYDGFQKSSDAWISLSNVYQINSQTKQIFNAQHERK